jgi:hypothetical protein
MEGFPSIFFCLNFLLKLSKNILVLNLDPFCKDSDRFLDDLGKSFFDRTQLGKINGKLTKI